MADTEYFVRSSANSGGDGTNNTDSSVDGSHAYDTLNGALSARAGSISGGNTVTFTCTSGDGTADSTAVNVTGWAPTDAESLRIIADKSDTTNGFYDGNLCWSTSHFRITGAHSAAFTINDANVRIDGLQIESTHTSANRYALDWVEDGSVIENCRITRDGNGSGSSHCINGNVSSHRAGGEVRCCIVFNAGTGGHGINLGTNGNATRTQAANNNAVHGCPGTGINWQTDDADLTYEWHNNVIWDCGTDQNTTSPTNASVTHDYNATEDSNSETNGVGTISTSSGVDMEDPSNATDKSRDVRGVASGALDGAGLNTKNPTNDLWGDAFGDPPDIGVYSIPAAAGGANPKGPLGLPLHGPLAGPVGP